MLTAELDLNPICILSPVYLLNACLFCVLLGYKSKGPEDTPKTPRSSSPLFQIHVMNPFWSMSTGSVRKVCNEWMPGSVVMLGRGGSSAGKKHQVICK